MMKRIIILLVIFMPFLQLQSQVLNVSEVTQEENQWCWAGVSACVLDYYGTPTSQCSIAEYTRVVETFPDISFGDEDCCISPSSCNNWNYNWGGPGSIQDILVHFAGISNMGVGSALSEAVVTSNIQENKVFVIRWGWTTGGGHFVVGHGLVDNNLYYMDPWYGEGLKVADYSWVCSGDNHNWTHTNIITSPVNIETQNEEVVKVYPNPVSNELILEANGKATAKYYEILNSNGQIVSRGEIVEKSIIQTGNFSPGLYIIKLDNGKTIEFKKIMKK